MSGLGDGGEGVSVSDGEDDDDDGFRYVTLGAAEPSQSTNIVPEDVGRWCSVWSSCHARWSSIKL